MASEPMASQANAATLPEPWRTPFEPAWEAFRAGSRPVGAVLLDARGRVVARGRNRSQEAAAPPGQLAGAAIAHAEINVLAQLPADRRYEGHRLCTTLEPCLLCSGALIHAHIGTVVHAAADSRRRGVQDVPRVGGLIAERWARREGPVEGPLALFGAMLMDLWGLVHGTPGGERGLPGGEFAPSARRCLDVDGFLDALTAQEAYRLAWPWLTVERPGPDASHRPRESAEIPPLHTP